MASFTRMAWRTRHTANGLLDSFLWGITLLTGGAMVLAVFLLSWPPPIHAAEVRLSLPEGELRGVIGRICDWHHCQSDANGSDKTDEEKAVWVANKLIEMVSMGHYHTLSDLNARLQIEWSP